MDGQDVRLREMVVEASWALDACARRPLDEASLLRLEALRADVWARCCASDDVEAVAAAAEVLGLLEVLLESATPVLTRRAS